MKRYIIGLLVAVVTLVLTGHADAQVPYVTYYAPAVPVTTYYAPPVAPVVQTSYYAPAPVVTYRPVPVTTTRYRPILGGTVTRVRTAYAPVVVNPTPVVYGY